MIIIKKISESGQKDVQAFLRTLAAAFLHQKLRKRKGGYSPNLTMQGSLAVGCKKKRRTGQDDGTVATYLTELFRA